MYRLFITGDLGFEFWKDIPGYEGLYQASTYGRIRSVKHKTRVLKPRRFKTGYLNVGLYKEGVQKVWLVHRLIGLTFLPNPENKPFMDHMDTEKTNNVVWNLHYVTREENDTNPLTAQHRERAQKNWVPPIKKGTQVYIYTLDSELVGSYASIKEASEAVGISKPTIIYALKGKHAPRNYIIRKEPLN